LSSQQPGVSAVAETTIVHGKEYCCVVKYSASFASEQLHNLTTSLSKAMQSLRRLAEAAWPGLSTEELLDQLRQIQKYNLLYPPQGDKGPNRVATVLSKQTLIQQSLVKVLGLDQLGSTQRGSYNRDKINPFGRMTYKCICRTLSKLPLGLLLREIPVAMPIFE